MPYAIIDTSQFITVSTKSRLLVQRAI